MKRNYSKVMAIGLGLAALLAVSPAPAQVSAAKQKSIQAALNEKSKAYRENLGQWDARARFLAQAPGLDYWVTGDGLSIDQYKFERVKDSYKSVTTDNALDKDTVFEGVKRIGNVVEMHFVNSNLNAGSLGKGARPGTVDYFASQDRMARGTKSYEEAYVTGVYSGVHVRHYQVDAQLRYDILVDPGHDPRQIEMSFKGIKGLNVKDGTKLTLGTSLGSLNMADLHVYQPVGNSARAVEAKFVVTNNGTVKIEVGSYDPRLPLVIDPLVFGSYVGANPLPTANADDVVNAITAESNGSLYMTGVTVSANFPISAGPYDKFNLQGTDAFLCYMDGNAYTVTYAAVLGGTGNDQGLGIGFEEDTRTLWVGGTTTSTDFAGRNNAKGSGTRAWLSKFVFSSTGVQPQFATYLNDPGALAAGGFRGVRVSKTGHVYVIGNSTTTLLGPQGYTNYLPNTITTAKKAGFVCCVDSTGNVVYRTMIGGKVDVIQNFGAVNATDDLTIVGQVQASNVEDTAVAPDPVFATSAGVFSGQTGVFSSGRFLQNRQAYVIQLKNDGTARWACLLGGADAETAISAAYDLQNNVYVTGVTGSFNFQRTPGAFQQDFSTPQIFLTKLRSDASEIIYSSGLRTRGNVTPTAISVDSRGNAYVGGIVGFTLNSPFPGIFVPSTPGSIVTTDRANGDPETAIDDEYNGGDTSVDPSNTGDVDADLPSTTDGFLTVMNPAGSALQYSSYIGEDSDDRVTDVFVDSIGGCWTAGYSQAVWNNFVTNVDFSDVNGIGAHITANAFKTTMPLGNPGPAQPNFGNRNGWAFKVRVALPRLVSIRIPAPQLPFMPGGFNAQRTIRVTIVDPAPAGGVAVTLTTSNASATSWDPNSVVLSQPLVIPAGATTIDTILYSLPVVTDQQSSIKVILDNDFKETSVTVLPWLSGMSLAPQVTEGGNDVTVNVNLSDFAPLGGLPVNLSTDRPDLVVLPNPAIVTVTAGAKNAQITIPTVGVDVVSSANITASFLGVNKSKTVTLNPAKLKDFTFLPSRVNRGDNSTATVRFYGKTGGQRTVTISQVSGDTGVLVNGQALPVNIDVPPQSTQFSFTVSTPLTISAGFATLKADDGVTNVNGTINIDPIDILDIVLSPALDVTSGTVLTGQVTLTRPAGPSGMTVNLSSSNPNAGTLSLSQVTIPAGQTASGSFKFNTAIVPSDVTTNIHATKTGFTDKYRTVIVRGIQIGLALNPVSVTGGTSSTGILTLSKPAPIGGLTVSLTSSDNAVAYMNPSTIVVPEGQAGVNFTVFTRKTPVQRAITITAIGSALVKSSKVLTVNPPGILGLTLDPSSVLGGTSSKATITLNTGAPAGTVITLTATPSGIVTLPSSVTVTAGLTQYSFFVQTKAIATTTPVTIKATLAPTSKSAVLIVRSPGLGGLTFNPTRVQGSKNATGTVTLDGPAPAGGIQVTLTSDDPTVAKVIGSSVVTIPAGKFSVNFPVQTFKISRTLAIKFTATTSQGIISGYLYVDP